MNEQLLRAEARELVRHKALGGSDDYLRARAKLVDGLYGKGARERIRELMRTIKEQDES
jgi:hypothetical protein